MTASILAENTLTEKMDSHVVHPSLENITGLLTNLNELLKQCSDEIAKQEPIYDVPRAIKPPELVAALSTYDYPRSHDDSRMSAESHDDVPKSLAKRPLPPLPMEPFRVNESIYEEISSFQSPKESAKIKASLQQAKTHLVESLRRCLHSLNKIFATMRPKQSNDSIKILEDTINADPMMNEKIALSMAEFKFAVLGSSESLQELKQRLENVIFVLEGSVANFIKVYESNYGDMLGAELALPMAQAKWDLSQAEARLAEVKGLEKELAATNVASTQAPVSTANNRFSLFGKTTSTTLKMEENALYDTLDVVKGMTRSAS